MKLFKICGKRCHLEALAVDNARTSLVVLLVGDNHLRKGGEGSKDGTTDPRGVLTLWWSDNLDLHVSWGKAGDFLLDTLWKASEHGGTTRKDDVSVHVLPDIDIALHDGVEDELIDTVEFQAVEVWFEEEFWGAGPLLGDGDDVASWEGVVDVALAGHLSLLHLLIEVEGDIGELLLDVTDDFLLGGRGEGVTTLVEDLLEVVGEVIAAEGKSQNAVPNPVDIVEWDTMADATTNLEHNTSDMARAVQGKHWLATDLAGRDGEALKHDLHHLSSLATCSRKVQGPQ